MARKDTANGPKPKAKSKGRAKAKAQAPATVTVAVQAAPPAQSKKQRKKSNNKVVSSIGTVGLINTLSKLVIGSDSSRVAPRSAGLHTTLFSKLGTWTLPSQVPNRTDTAAARQILSLTRATDGYAPITSIRANADYLSFWPRVGSNHVCNFATDKAAAGNQFLLQQPSGFDTTAGICGNLTGTVSPYSWFQFIPTSVATTLPGQTRARVIEARLGIRCQAGPSAVGEVIVAPLSRALGALTVAGVAGNVAADISGTWRRPLGNWFSLFQMGPTSTTTSDVWNWQISAGSVPMDPASFSLQPLLVMTNAVDWSANNDVAPRLIVEFVLRVQVELGPGLEYLADIRHEIPEHRAATASRRNAEGAGGSPLRDLVSDPPAAGALRGTASSSPDYLAWTRSAAQGL